MSLKITVLTKVSTSISNKEQLSSLLKLIVIQGKMFRQFRTLTYIWRTAGRTAYGVSVRRNSVEGPQRMLLRCALVDVQQQNDRRAGVPGYIRRQRRRTAGRTA